MAQVAMVTFHPLVRSSSSSHVCQSKSSPKLFKVENRQRVKQIVALHILGIRLSLDQTWGGLTPSINGVLVRVFKLWGLLGGQVFLDAQGMI